MGVDIRVLETAEAVCGGLHYSGFTHLGDTDQGKTSWFTRTGGTSVQTIRIRVERSDIYPAVFTTVEYWNTFLKKPGRSVLQLDCKTTHKDLVKQASEQMVLRCLEIFKEVLTKTGVAGPQAAAHAQAWHTSTGLG